MADIETMYTNLQNLISFPDQVGEPDRGSKGDQLGSGDTYDYLTYPGSVNITKNESGSGIIEVPYSCRVRHKHYVARVETSTEDSQHPAKVVADYAFTFSGQVMISNVRVDGNQEGNCAHSVVERLRSLNGSNVG
ncbi:hypothetical protein AAIH69_13620 [Paenibacillus sp. MABNS29]|uniref:hypothetical protein n=1 Tax=Paenibacillus TaxID=44249 RepID=UPI00096F9E7B|nr:hypothetical protein [Paenibacillus peoriae]OMF39741.1 hypothetical protein BK135_24880 [Paenibacillus peoriae]